MENMNDEMIEFDDMDEDIRRKQELIEEVKALSTENVSSDALRQINDLKRRWNRIHYWESDYEDGLRDEFEGYVDAVYAKRNELYKNASEAKNALIQKASELAKSKDLSAATPAMNALMDEWKSIGTAGKNQDDDLWEKFQAARQVFYDRKHQEWQDQNERFEKAREAKTALIEKAVALKGSTEWNKASVQFKELMDEWKAAGSAGRKFEDALWKEFNAARQEFYSARSVYYDEVQKKQQVNYEEKKKLVQEAQDILDSNDFSRANTDRMKALSQDWKKVGYCGKEKDDRVWKEFRAVMDVYFDSLKKNNDQRHADWVARMEDAKERKQDMIANQKRQIERLEEESNGLISQGRAEEIRDQIEDKEDFIAQLESEIEDIDKKIAE
jgi:hypothetical protein